MYTASFFQDPDFIRSLYIVAFSMFIFSSLALAKRYSEMSSMSKNCAPGIRSARNSALASRFAAGRFSVK